MKKLSSHVVIKLPIVTVIVVSNDVMHWSEVANQRAAYISLSDAESTLLKNRKLSRGFFGKKQACLKNVYLT